MATSVITTKTAVRPPSFPTRVIKPKEDTLITWTEKSKFHKPGSTSVVHAAMADKYVASGQATKGKKNEPMEETEL